MPYWYCDAATGDTVASGNTGADWANAIDTLKELLESSALGAGDNESVAGGDTIFVRANASETTEDTVVGIHAFTSPAQSFGSPVKIVGIKTGITRTGAGILKSDFAVNTGEMPVISCTGAGNDITFAGGQVFDFGFIKFSCPDRFQIDGAGNFYQCHITCDNINALSADLTFRDCNINVGNDADAGSGLGITTSGGILVLGGTISNPTSQTNLCRINQPGGLFEFIGVDMSGLTITNVGTATAAGGIRLKNCRLSYTNILPAVPTEEMLVYAELIGCSNATAAKSTSYQDYDYYDSLGTVKHEGTIVRTGGATDNSLGQFSYAMQMHANSGLEGTMAALRSPTFRVWVEAGAKLLQVFIVNDSAGPGQDLNEDECWCEFYTPNNADTADHTLTIATNTVNDFAQIAEGTSPITDDDSVWVTVNTHKQKFSKTINVGHAGWAYARVWLAKRQATPDIVYVDPKIVVT